MPTKPYCKNSFVLARELPAVTAAQAGDSTAQFNGRAVLTPVGHQAQPGGLIMLDDSAVRLTTSKSCHELEIVAVSPQVYGLRPGHHVIVYLGGDTAGSVNANGISAFTQIDGAETFAIHESFIWARVEDGTTVFPRGKIVLTERDDEAFKRHALGATRALLLHLPEANLAGGLAATGSTDPTEGGARALDSVTHLYERVVRVGPLVRDVLKSEVVAFSPSYSATRLTIRRSGSRPAWHGHLVDSEEIFFSVDG